MDIGEGLMAGVGFTSPDLDAKQFKPGVHHEKRKKPKATTTFEDDLWDDDFDFDDSWVTLPRYNPWED